MNLIKFNPFLPLNVSLGDTFETFFERGLGDFLGSDLVNEMPRANVKLTNGAFEIEVAAPGFSREDFEIKVEENHLIVSAQKKSEIETDDGEYRRREFSFGSFSRSFKLDDSINLEEVTAKYEGGILKLHLPQQNKLETQRVIEIS